MDLNMDVHWKRFIEDNCGNNGVPTITPLYNVMANNFPIQLTKELIFFARNENFDIDISTRRRAAFLLEDMADDPHRLDNAYPTIDRETTLLYLRRCSFRLMVDNEKWSPFQNAGIALAKKLITLALKHGEEWDEFLELLQRGFSGQPHVVELIFDIFLVLESFNTCFFFTLFISPIVKQHRDQFRTGVIDLLQSGGVVEDDSHVRNYRGFKILMFFYFVFFDTQDHQNSVMEAAFMSPMFDYDPHPDAEIMVFSAKCIQICIRFGPAFALSSHMINKMSAILGRLNASPDQPNGRTVARELINVLRGFGHRSRRVMQG